MADLCSEPLVGTHERNEELTDHDGTTITYRTPAGFFATEADAREFAETVAARMPFSEPYDDDNVTLGSPWSRNGGVHGAVDYWRTNSGAGIDPAFRVHAVADGTVKAIVWSHWLGNVVVVEHKAPNGERYRSLYHHLRNGYTSDLENGEAYPEPSEAKSWDKDGNATLRRRWYEYVHLSPRPADWKRWWGSESQVIDVKAGQKVSRGDPIGWSGNTGYGGAGYGLESDPEKTVGMPTNAHTANNHLHFEFAVPAPSGSDWVRIDPYGVYGDSSACYALDKEIPYKRLFAPFSRSFSNLPLDRLERYWYYWTGIGLGLRTITVQRAGNKVLASGSFQGDVDPAWRAKLWMTRERLDANLVAREAEGLRPTSVDVGIDSNGQPRFSVIWRKSAPKDSKLVPAATNAELDKLWADRVTKHGARFDCVATYQNGGARRHAVIVVDDGDPSFVFHPLMTQAQFKDKYVELEKAWVVHAQQAAMIGNGVRFNAVWRPKQQSDRPSRVNLSHTDYNKEFRTLGAGGYRLHQVQSYRSGSLFAAVWTKS